VFNFVERGSQLNEKYLDNSWSIAVHYYSRRNSSNLSLDSSAHEFAVDSSALGFGHCNPRSCRLLCLASWQVAAKEES
jgi:hypothetical protein